MLHFIHMNSYPQIRLTDPAYLIGILLAHSDAKPGSDTITVMPQWLMLVTLANHDFINL